MRGWDHIPPGWRWELVVRTPVCGFYTVQGRIDPGDNHIRPQCVGAADVWKNFLPGYGILSSPGGAGVLAYAGSMAGTIPVPYQPPRKNSSLWHGFGQ